MDSVDGWPLFRPLSERAWLLIGVALAALALVAATTATVFAHQARQAARHPVFDTDFR
jgi:hypothetical protein